MSNEDVKAAAWRVLEEIFPADDEIALVTATSADFVNHEAPPGTPSGPGSVIYYMHLLAKAFSDQRWTIHRVIAEGDTAVVYCTHSGRHTGDYFGIKPSGHRFAYKQMHMVRVREGQGVEHWAVRDDATLMRQLTGELTVPDPIEPVPSAQGEE